jgi:hypothetical protein
MRAYGVLHSEEENPVPNMGKQIPGGLRVRRTRNRGKAQSSRLQTLDVIVRWIPVAAIVVGGAWALYRWYAAGANDWTINMNLVTEVMPYSEGTRLLVIHLKTKNPADHSVEFEKPKSDFRINVFEMPSGVKPNTLIDGAQGRRLASLDLMSSEPYLFLPLAEFEDSAAVVLPKGVTVFVEAVLKKGEDDISVDKVVLVSP